MTILNQSWIAGTVYLEMSVSLSESAGKRQSKKNGLYAHKNASHGITPSFLLAAVRRISSIMANVDFLYGQWRFLTFG